MVKIKTHLQHLPRKKTLPLSISIPPEFQQLFRPHLIIKKKFLQFKKGGGTENVAQCCTQSFLHILVDKYTMHQSGSEEHPLWLGHMLEKFLEIATTKLLKMSFPVQQLFLKTLPQRCWPQYLGNYTNYTDGGYFAVLLYIYIISIYLSIYLSIYIYI